MQRWQRRSSPASESGLLTRARRRTSNARARRLAAWLVTGPVGHLYGGVADLTALLARYALARARGRDPSSAG
jgi:hypothetical protein